MDHWLHTVRQSVALLALFTLSGCGSPDSEQSTQAPTVPEESPVEVPVDNTVDPASVPSDLSSVEVVTASPSPNPSDASTEQPTVNPTQLSIDVPEGGAVARVGNREESVANIACTVIDDVWAASGGTQDGTMVAVRTTTGDDLTVDSASIIFPDGIIAQVQPEVGQATIERQDQRFTVTGTAQRLNLNEEQEPAVEVPFLIQASCPA